MAKKPKSENYDTLGSIFDFLFKEARKPPERRKPIRPTGVAGDSQLTDAIFSALELPGAFISDTVVGELNDALDLELGRVTYGDFGNVKFTTNSIIDTLKDPVGAFDKAISKNQAIRKSMRATYAGQFMKDFVAAGWARKYGDIEVQDIVNRNIRINEREEKYKTERAMGQQRGNRFLSRGGGFDYTISRNAELLGRAVFGYDNWIDNRSLTQQQKERFIHLASNLDGNFDAAGKPLILPELENFLTSEFGPGNAYIGNLKASIVDEKGKVQQDLSNTSLYAQLESRNIDSVRASLLSQPNTPEIREKVNVLDKTKLLISNRELDKKNEEIRNSIDTLKRQYRSATTQQEKSEIRKKIKDNRTALSMINNETFWGHLGRWEGYMGSINSVLGSTLGENALISVLNGDFYDSKKNSLPGLLAVPVNESDLDIGAKKKLEFFTAKVATRKDGSVNKLLTKWYEMGTQLYYTTPRSLFRTLFVNGEGFAYQLNNKVLKMDPALLSGILLGPVGHQANATPEMLLASIGKLNGKDLDLLVNDVLTQARGSLTPSQLRELESRLKGAKGLRNRLQTSSSLFRFQARIINYFEKRTKAIRTSFAKWLLKNQSIRKLFAGSTAGKLLGQWIAKGGLDTLMRSLVTVVASALGIALTPIGSAIITALTWVATDLVMKAIGATINILKFLAIGLVGLLVLFILWGNKNVINYDKQTFSYYTATPGSVVQCAMYQEQDLETGEDGDWGDAIIPPDSTEQCLIGDGGFWCSQGYKDVGTWSHRNIKAQMPVDITGVSYIYAPQFCDSGSCSITRIGKINCSDGTYAGGIVEFDANNGTTTYHFKLLHVKPLAGQGEKLSSGQAVAVVMDSPEVEKGFCWTGKHLHLEVKQNGSSVDPLDLLQGFNCSVPDESQCARPS